MKVAADKKIEEGLDFCPKFGSDGLITAIAQDAENALSLHLVAGE